MCNNQVKSEKKSVLERNKIKRGIITMATYRSLVLCLVLLIVNTIVSTNGLQCYQCGQFNDGVGSITPCLNYSEKNAHNYLKECPRKTDKFCVVSSIEKKNLWHEKFYSFCNLCLHHQKKKIVSYLQGMEIILNFMHNFSILVYFQVIFYKLCILDFFFVPHVCVKFDGNMKIEENKNP